jgi:hypothetical protein
MNKLEKYALDQKSLLERKCGFCQNVFTPKRVRDTEQIFCTVQCSAEFFKAENRQKTKDIRSSVINKCKLCEHEFTPEKTLRQIYCSKRCRQYIPKKIHTVMQRMYNKMGTTKTDHSSDVLGYSPDDLLARLQQCSNWDDLKDKDWHLDHIFPIKAFLEHNIRDIKLICCLDNLQPLPGEDNCKKNGSYVKADFEKWLKDHHN